jgi:electron transfer flavoprotein beta subunit
MNIAVCVKSAIDEAELKADSFGRPVLQGAISKMSTFDKNAVEEAVRQKEAKGGSVTVISLGSRDTKAIKEALAMGADKAMTIPADGSTIDAMATSYYLAKLVGRIGGVDLVICSEGASDTYQGQVGAMMAEWLGQPFLAYVKKVDTSGNKVRCESVLEDRVEVVEATMPAVISVGSETNQPRYPTLLQIMQASKKPIEEVQMASLKGQDLPDTGVQVLDATLQSMNRKKILFEGTPAESAKSLVDALKREGTI